jgi:hypothetical protein
LRFDFALVIGIPSGCTASIAVTTEAPHQLTSRRGQDPEAHPTLGTGHSTALFAQRSQSFLDNLIAGPDLLLRDLAALGLEKKTPTFHYVAFDVAFGGKADMPFCTAHVRF